MTSYSDFLNTVLDKYRGKTKKRNISPEHIKKMQKGRKEAKERPLKGYIMRHSDRLKDVTEDADISDIYDRELGVEKHKLPNPNDQNMKQDPGQLVFTPPQDDDEEIEEIKLANDQKLEELRAKIARLENQSLR